MVDTVWNRVLRIWGTPCHCGRALWNRPILRDQRCVLFPDHRSERAVGRVGLRVHRVRTLLFLVRILGFDASADKAPRKERPPIRNKDRIENLCVSLKVLRKEELTVLADVVKEFLSSYPE